MNKKRKQTKKRYVEKHKKINEIAKFSAFEVPTTLAYVQNIHITSYASANNVAYPK